MNRVSLNEPLGVAVVGTGRLGRRMGKAVRQVEETRLIGVYDTDASAAGSFAASHQGVDVYESFAQILQDERVAGVCVCTPPDSHTEQVTKLLEAGKHVLVEKPLGHTLAAAGQIRNAARRYRGLVVMVGSALLTFLPSVGGVRRWLQDGRLGKPYLVRAVYNHGVAPDGWFQDPGVSGGGSLIDLAYHPLTVLDYLFGGGLDWNLAFARLRSNVTLSVEDTAQLLVECNDSLSGYLELCWGVADPTRELEIIGDEGAAKILFQEDKAVFEGGKDRVEPRCCPSRYIELTEREVAHFADCIRRGVRPQAGDVETAYRIQGLIEGAYRLCGQQAGPQPPASPRLAVAK